MMRYAHMFIDRGQGWENLTPSDQPYAALAGFSIQWGTDDPSTQPDPNVLTFQLRDTDGTLAGKAMSLAGAQVIIQMSNQPTWGDWHEEIAWQDVDSSIAWGNYFNLFEPRHDTPEPESDAMTIFQGTISTGGTLHRDDSGVVKLDLSATSVTALLKRSVTKGPTSTDSALNGYHWTGTPADRADEIAHRMTQLGTFPLISDALAWVKAHVPASVKPYDMDSYPDLITVLHSLTASSPSQPLYYERHEKGKDWIGPVPAADIATIVMHSDGSISARTDLMSQPAIDADEIVMEEPELSLPEPLSALILKGAAVTWNDSDKKLDFEDAELTFTDQNRLPTQLKTSQKTVSIDTDAILEDKSDGHFTQSVYVPSESDRGQVARYLETNALRLRPSELVADSRFIDINKFQAIFIPSASGPWAFVRNQFTDMLSDDGTPATSGAWLSIGGTLTYSFLAHHPVWRNELTFSPLPVADTELPTWESFNSVSLPWSDLHFTWAELGQITTFEK